MKRLILTFVTSFLILCLHAQKWQHTIGFPGTLEEGREVIEHYDHGYLVTSSRSAGSGDHHGWLVKTDINGNKLWDIELGMNPDVVFIYKTLYDNEGYIYIFGLLKQDLPLEYPLVVKLNACGEKQWCRLLAIEGFDFGYFKDAIFLDNGDLLGLAYMPDDDYNERILMFRISPDGDCLWHKVYTPYENNPYFGNRGGYSLDKFNDMYIISGYVYSPYPEGNPNHAWLRPMFIGIDEDFEEQWVVEFGINDSLLGKAYRTVQINDSLFMGVGTNRWVDNGIETDNSFLMFYNKKGEETGHKLIYGSDINPGLHQNLIFDIEQIDQEKYLCAVGIGEAYQGSNYGELVIDTAGNVYDYAIRENSGGGRTYMVKTFDNKYTVACSHKTPNTNYDIMLYKINAYLEQDTVYPGNYTYDSLCRHTIQSGIVDLAGCDVITAIHEIPTLEQYKQKMQGIPLHASPNPSNTGEVLLEMENTGLFPKLQIEVFDVFGNQIHSERVYPQQGAARLDTSQWPAGIYVATIFSNGQIKGKCKILVE